jgi:hypothetical protein
MRFISQCLMFLLGVLLILGVSINRLLAAAIHSIEQQQHGDASWQMADISHHLHRADQVLMDWEKRR